MQAKAGLPQLCCLYVSNFDVLCTQVGTPCFPQAKLAEKRGQNAKKVADMKKKASSMPVKGKGQKGGKAKYVNVHTSPRSCELHRRCHSSDGRFQILC